MLLSLSLSILISIIILLMIFIVILISKKTFLDREKNSPFECGFSPISCARISFSLHFFMVAMIFLIFDVELTLLFPLIFSIKSSSPMEFWLLTISFIIILLAGTLHEWKQGALDWV